MMSLIARETQSSELVGSSHLQNLLQDSGLGRATGYHESGSMSHLCLAPWSYVTQPVPEIHGTG